MSLQNSIRSAEEVSTDRLMIMPRPGPPVSSGVQHLTVVLPGDRHLLEAQPALVEQLAVGVDRVDDHELRSVEADVPLEQRQHAAADGAEADHHDRAGELRRAGRGLSVMRVSAFMSVAPMTRGE